MCEIRSLLCFLLEFVGCIMYLVLKVGGTIIMIVFDFNDVEGIKPFSH